MWIHISLTLDFHHIKDICSTINTIPCLGISVLLKYYISINRADSRLAPSQWEMALQCNAISHWLSTNLESALTQLLPLIQGHSLEQNWWCVDYFIFTACGQGFQSSHDNTWTMWPSQKMRITSSMHYKLKTCLIIWTKITRTQPCHFFVSTKSDVIFFKENETLIWRKLKLQHVTKIFSK